MRNVKVYKKVLIMEWIFYRRFLRWKIKKRREKVDSGIYFLMGVNEEVQEMKDYDNKEIIFL